MLLNYLYRIVSNFSIKDYSGEKFKFLYHPKLDYCRINYKGIHTAVFHEREKHLFYQDEKEVFPAFLLVHSVNKKGCPYLHSNPKSHLYHGKIYADFVIKVREVEFLEKSGSFLTFYEVEKVILNRYNKYLKTGIPFKIIIPTQPTTENTDSKITDKATANNDSEIFEQKGLKHVYFPKPTDREKVYNYYQTFCSLSDSELVNRYNQVKALYGAHEQILSIIGLDLALKKRFGKSPIENEANTVFGLGGKIVYLPMLKTYEKVNEN